MSVALDAAAVTELAGKVSGPVLTPEDPGYDAARAVHNGLIDKRPAVIVRAHGRGRRRRRAGGSRATPGSRSRCAAAATTSPAVRSRTAAS